MQLFCRFKNVYGVVGNALKVSDDFQKPGGFLAVVRTELTRAELYKIRAENILVVVSFIFKDMNFVVSLLRVGGERIKAELQRLECRLAHFASTFAAAV